MMFPSAPGPRTPGQPSREPLGRHRVFHTRALDEARDLVARAFCPHLLMTSGPRAQLDARLHSACFGVSSSLHFLQYGCEVVIDPGQLDDFYLLQIPLRGGGQVCAGRERFDASPQLASLPSPRQSLSMRWIADSPHLILRVTRAAVDDQFRALMQRDPERAIVFAPRAPLQSSGMAMLHPLLTQLAQWLDSDAGLPHALGLQSEAFILSTMLLGLPHDQQHPCPSTSGGPSAARGSLVRAALDYMHAHLDSTERLDELCRATRSPARTLQQAFRNEFGRSPMQVWRDLKLDEARRQLLQARQRGESVMQVATRLGFAHAGRFAIQYRERFGESPCRTRRG